MKQKSPKTNSTSDKLITRRGAIKAAAAAATVAGLSKDASAKQRHHRRDKAAKSNEPRNLPCNGKLNVIANTDYQRSLQQYGGRMANPIRDLFLTSEKDQVHFAVAVIGSGYGASIMAARLSKALRADARICNFGAWKRMGAWNVSRYVANDMGRSSTTNDGAHERPSYQPVGLVRSLL